MVRFMTTRFGLLETPEDQVISFPDGLLGFPLLRRYVVVDRGGGPLRWLQAVDDPAVAFIVADPREVAPDRPILPGSDVLRFFGAEGNENFEILVIVRVEGGDVVPNLKGPLAIHRSRRVGVQAVLERA